jgi:hypothetical protein
VVSFWARAASQRSPGRRLLQLLAWSIAGRGLFAIGSVGVTRSLSQPLSYYYRINYISAVAVRRGRFKGGRRFSRWVPRARIPIKRSLRHFARHRKRSLLSGAAPTARSIPKLHARLRLLRVAINYTPACKLAGFFNCAQRDSSVTFMVQKRNFKFLGR